LKVGVDARLLSRPITGIGKYTLEMCRALSKIENIALYLYSPAPTCAEYAQGLETAIIRTKFLNNGFLRQFWSESYLPVWAKKDEIDVFWGPAHRLPHLLSSDIARVVTIHDLVWKNAGNTMRPLSRLLERYQMPKAINSADHIVTDSKATSDTIQKEFSINNNDLSVIYPGVNVTENGVPVEKLQQLGISNPYFLFVGTLEPRKNLKRLLTAYSRLSFKRDIMFVIVGAKGWGGVNISDLVTELGLTKHVCILGYVEHSILELLYANTLFLAMPSLYEGFGLPLIEAMAHGAPVLTSSNSSMPEVAGDAGLLVDALDVNSILNGLIQMIKNKELLSKLAMNAKNNAARFSWGKSTQQLVTVFENAILSRNLK